MILFEPNPDRLTMHLGLMKKYVGYISVPAHTMLFSRGGNHDLGHALL